MARSLRISWWASRTRDSAAAVRVTSRATTAAGPTSRSTTGRGVSASRRPTAPAATTTISAAGSIMYRDTADQPW